MKLLPSQVLERNVQYARIVKYFICFDSDAAPPLSLQFPVYIFSRSAFSLPLHSRMVEARQELPG